MKAKIPKSNLTPGEWKALTTLKKDDNITILPADKGKCLVVMDTQEYITKMEDKLNDITTYKQIMYDPTKEIKETLTNKLQEIRDKEEIDNKLYKKLLPTKTKIPRMYGQPKIHKQNNPLREIVDSTDSVTKDIDKFISNIIKTYIGKSPYYVKNSAHFTSMIKDLKVEEDESLVSYDVTALYPSVPQDEAIEIIYDIMKRDQNLSNKTTMSAESIIDLFKICVQKTYFVFNKKLYIQINGLAIGASTSGFAADLFMEKLETKALSTFSNPPTLWKRYVDDTFSKMKKQYIEPFLTHLNNQHPRIKFTTEIQDDENKIAYLDTLVHVQNDNSIKITIYRKATHTDQYLDFRSNHHIKQKIGIISTFRHRINKLVTNEEDKKEEEAHVINALKRCGHPDWLLKKGNKNNKKRPKEKEKYERDGRVIIPYTKTLSENLARIYKRYNIETIHKPTVKLKNLLCNKMKDKIEDLDKTGAIYYNICKKHENATYIGETERALRERLYEHRIVDHKTASQAASLAPQTQQETPQQEPTVLRRSTRKRNKVDYKAMHECSNQQITEGNTEFSAHVATDLHNKQDFQYKILNTENNWYKRGIKEAIAIRQYKPSLNKDGGRYHLSAIYNDVIDNKMVPKHKEKSGWTPVKH